MAFASSDRLFGLPWNVNILVLSLSSALSLLLSRLYLVNDWIIIWYASAVKLPEWNCLSLDEISVIIKFGELKFHMFCRSSSFIAIFFAPQCSTSKDELAGKIIILPLKQIVFVSNVIESEFLIYNA